MQLDNKALGRRIRYFRKRRGLSQAGLAELVDCGNTYISYIETAKKGVGLEMLVSIANALHVSADELLIDSLDTVLKVSSFQFSELLTDCSDYEIRVLLDVLVSAKDAMRKNSSFHYKPRK